MSVFNCKSCGGDLEIKEGTTVVTCEYCGRQQTVPSMDNEKKVNLFNRANRLRSKCDFDKAASVYESIVAEFPQESEAYWGLCLCKFGIEYVDDPGTANKIPTCHRTSYESIFDDQNFHMACENADALAVNQLRNEAKEIDRLQKEILEIAKNEQPFDVFICYKETDDMGGRTIDSELAHDIYDVLTEKGYKVFYSRITLKAKLGHDYEPYIFSALNSAKVMLSIGTKYEYFNAVWVKNEWSRFLSLMKSDKSKMLIPCYRDIDPYDMPKEFSGLQGQDLSSPRAFQDLVTNIEKIIPKATIQSNSISASAPTDPLIKRAFLCLEDGDWSGADKCCEKVLDTDPENARAYLIKLCLELKVKKPADISNNEQPLDNNSNFKKALRFADEQFKKELESYNNAIHDRINSRHKNDLYNEAVNKMNSAVTPADFKAAKEIFQTISGYKDSDRLAEECDDSETMKRAWIYDDGIKKMNTAQSVDEYLQARKLFQSVNGFRDSKELAEKCNENIYNIACDLINQAGSESNASKIIHIVRTIIEYRDSEELANFKDIAEKCNAQIYHIACDLMKRSGSESNTSEIIKILETISEYRDSRELAALIEDGALEYYNKAKVAVRNDDFSRAAQFLESISDFFDAGELAQHCRNVIKQNGNKDSKDYKILQSFSQISGGFNHSSRKPKTNEKTVESEQAKNDIYEKASAFFKEGDYGAAGNWFKKIPEYKDVNERLKLIERINLFSDSCNNTKEKYEQELAESFKKLTATGEINKISRAVLLSCCLWSAYFLIFLIGWFLSIFSYVLDFIPSWIIPILFIPCVIASIIMTKKAGAPKRAAIPIAALVITAGYGIVAVSNIHNMPVLSFILFAVLAVMGISYRQKSKKHEKSIQACKEIKYNLNSDIDKLKRENETIADYIKREEVNRIFGEEPWNGLVKPTGYTDEYLKEDNSSKLFSANLLLTAANIILVIILSIIIANIKAKANEYSPVDGIYSNNSLPQSLPENNPNAAESILKMLEKNRGLVNKNLTLAANDQTVAVKNDGTVVAVGDNKYGQCDVSEWKDIVSVATGQFHTVGLKRNGTAVAVGSNDYHELNVSDWKNIIAVAAGNNHTVLLKADGTVMAMGYDGMGQCEVHNWKDIVAIDAAFYHTIGVKSDGTVVIAGGNYTHDLGQFDVSGWRDIVAVSAGNYHNVGLRSNGTVVAVGNNESGELNVSGWRDIIAISAGSTHTVGLKSDGTVVATGFNGGGQCDVSDWTDIVAIAAGVGHTVGLKADGTIVTTGSGEALDKILDWTDIAIPGTESINMSSNTQNTSNRQNRTAAQMAETALAFDPDSWSSGMTRAENDDILTILLPDINTDMLEDYCFYYDMMPIYSHTIFIGKPKSGQENTVKTSLEKSLDTAKETGAFYPDGQKSISGAVIGTSDDGYYYMIIHKDGAAIASTILSSTQ